MYIKRVTIEVEKPKWYQVWLPLRVFLSFGGNRYLLAGKHCILTAQPPAPRSRRVSFHFGVAPKTATVLCSLIRSEASKASSSYMIVKWLASKAKKNENLLQDVLDTPNDVLLFLEESQSKLK